VSVQFGRWNFDGRPVEPDYIAKVNALLAPYAPDGCSSHSAAGLTILYHAFHTTKESRREKQPHISTSGAVVTWDGRLDNRKELIRELADVLTGNSTDVEIAAAAYEQWGERSFAKLIGDWALAIWNPATRSLILAKDVIGTRHLYYAAEESRITWSTILDPLVLLAGRKFQLCEEYIAGWLGFFPATHLTPYVGIDSVPPSCFVRLQPGKREIRKYWDFDPHKRILYRTDAEYEEHFRIVFAEAVRRRLRSDSPVLAELSGGMDSSSIVCMADEIIARGLAETPRVDTISYYDDSEPNWNERPYFAKVEQKRGQMGSHINVSERCSFPSSGDCFAVTPATDGSAGRAISQFGDLLALQGYRALLSGTGGDEVTGGVPTPAPELEDLLVRGRIVLLAHSLKLWALTLRKPWTHLLFEAARGFLPVEIVGLPKHMRPARWLNQKYARRYRRALSGYQERLKIFGPSPSVQDSVTALNAVRRQIECCTPSSLLNCDRRYPYLDRAFLEFMYAVPRNQLVRPGQRRSLMRRALVGIVPDEILNRKRKAFVVRAPVRAVSSQSDRLLSCNRNMVTVAQEITDEEELLEALKQTASGLDRPALALMRTLSVEQWLRRPAVQNVLKSPASRGQRAAPNAGFFCGWPSREHHGIQLGRVESQSIRIEEVDRHEVQQTRSSERGSG